MTQEQQMEEWLRFAKDDLSAAQFLTKLVPTPIEIICFHCQQAAEKGLKAMLVASGEPLLKTHDLQKLYSVLLPIYPNLAPLEEHCLVLTGYGSLVRYPLHLEIPANHIPKALQLAEECLDLVQRILKQN